MPRLTRLVMDETACSSDREIPSTLGNPPTVAIVGRPNVGKSALFNRLAKRRISIVHDQAGVTRDRITTTCHLTRHPITLMDTGGIGATIGDGFDLDIEREAGIAVEVADVLLLVVDGQAGLTPVDQALATQLRRSGKPLILVVNKIDHPRQMDRAVDFAALGISELVSISAAHGTGTDQLVEAMDRLLDPQYSLLQSPREKTQVPLKIAIVGRPNAGKSSLVNAILDDERTIVSEVAGTTRDAVDVPCLIHGREAILIDTAGLRHRSRHRTSVEVFSAMRAEESIRRADLCLLVIDLLEGVTMQDKKIGQLIQEAHKPCLIVGSKLDLLEDQMAPGQLREVEEALREELFFLAHAPLVPTSAAQKKNLTRLFRQIKAIEEGAARRISTGRLNRLLEEIQTRNPPPVVKGRRLKILYGTAVEEGRGEAIPVPVFVLFVNDNSLMPDHYRRYLEGQLRKVEPFPGLPILLRLRGRGERVSSRGGVG